METYPDVLRRHGTITWRPEYRTEVTQYASGEMQRDQWWFSPIFRADIRYDPLLPEAFFDPLEAFFHRVRGRGEVFWFQDWTRPNRTLQEHGREVLGEGNGEQRTFKVYGDRAGAVAVYVDDTLQSQPGQVTVDLATGLVTFVDPPAAGARITADVIGEWFRMAFDEDVLEAQRHRARAWRWGVRLVQDRRNVMVVAAEAV